MPIVPVVCENYNRLFDGKTRFEGGTIRIKVLEPIPTIGLGKDDVNDLTERVRDAMLKTLGDFDADRERFDLSTVFDAAQKSKGAAGPNSAPTTPPNLGAGEAGLGGVAGWMAKIVGTGKGKGKDYDVSDRKQAEDLRRESTSGSKPADYDLRSEADKSEAQASSLPGSARRLAKRIVGGSNSTGDSSEETEGSAILVEPPSTTLLNG